MALSWLKGRSVGGALMAAGQVAFAAHFVLLVLNAGPQREKPALFRRPFGQVVESEAAG